MSHLYKDGTAFAWPDGKPVPPAYADYELRAGPVPGPPPPGPDPRDAKIAELETALAAVDARLKTVEDKEKP